MEPTWGGQHSVMLPSGHRVVARRISLVGLLWAGGFPNDLTAMVWKMFNQDVNSAKLGQDADSVRKMVGLIEQVVLAVLVTPDVARCKVCQATYHIGALPEGHEVPQTAVTAGPDGHVQGTVAIGDIPDIDKKWLLFFGQGLIRTDEERTAAGQAPGPTGFRDEPLRPDAGPAGAAVRPAPLGSGWPPAPQPAGARFRRGDHDPRGTRRGAAHGSHGARRAGHDPSRRRDPRARRDEVRERSLTDDKES
jgi:hypothetical protein